MSIDDSDIYRYLDLWKCPTERLNMACQGIGKDNMLKHRFGAGDASSDKEDEPIADAYKNRFCIPLDFEMLETHMPFEIVSDAELVRQINQQNVGRMAVL